MVGPTQTALYVGHTGTIGMGTWVLDVTDPVRPRPGQPVARAGGRT
jgi:hypothetical protein